jgi:hypothetical protein
MLACWNISEIFRMFNIFDEKFSPTNIDKADGTPLRLYTSARVKVDVSKRRKHDMGFRHRNIDAHEIIFCVKGALRWETEMGVKTMHPGDMRGGRVIAQPGRPRQISNIGTAMRHDHLEP